jgi:hypothetical protein
MYIDLSEADTFFNDFVLDSDAWDIAEDNKKTVALNEATLLIDRLNYAGYKADSVQALQFPRGADTEVPEDIKRACCYIALELLDGINLDFEFNNLFLKQHSYGGAASTYDRSSHAEHVIAGIPSIRAWRLLRPYLRDPRQIKVDRV